MRLPLIPFPKTLKMREGKFVWPIDSGIKPESLLAWVADRDSRLTLDGDHAVQILHDTELEDSNYELIVEPNLITISTGSKSGLQNAARTLVQLFDHSAEIECLSIEDGPRFGWRGVMLDPSRHFLPLPWILKFVDLMSMLKLNRLHLHLCDDQGWRIEIKKYPKLTEIGGVRRATPWAPGSDDHDDTPHSGYYTQAELRSLVDYAAERGIVVMPEIELPGHATSALAAYPELANHSRPIETSIRFGVHDDIYNVEDATLRFLEDVLEEVLEIFPSEFIHIGGDEVPKTQWKASEAAQQRMQQEGLANEDELQSWFIKHFDRWLAYRGRRLVGWDEILEGGLAPGATVMSWRGMEGGIAAATAGHDVVMCPVQHCYFDHYQAAFKSGEPTAIGGNLPLSKVYAFEPVPSSLDESAVRHVLGGQANFWSEYMRTTDQVEYMALPRLLALSEVLWGKPEPDSFEEFLSRVEPVLRRLSEKGYRFRPLSPEVPDNFLNIGTWAVGDLAGDERLLNFAVNQMVSVGDEILAQYMGGAWSVEFSSPTFFYMDGTTIESEHEGRTGNFDRNNRIKVPQSGELKSISLKMKSVGDGDTTGTIYLVNNG